MITREDVLRIANDIYAQHDRFVPDDIVYPMADRIAALAVERSKAAVSAPDAEPVAFVIDDKRINDLQVSSIGTLIQRAKHAHYCNVYLRINGKDELFEADWIKHMQPSSSVAAQVEKARREEREAIKGIISDYRISKGNSPAGELAAEFTLQALQEILEAIRQRGESNGR